MYIFSHLKDLKLFFSSSYLQIWNPLSITRQISRRRCMNSCEDVSADCSFPIQAAQAWSEVDYIRTTTG